MKGDKIRMEGVTVADLPETMQLLAEEIGVLGTLAVMRMLGGTRVYIPSIESVQRKLRDAMIRGEFTGYNCRELAKKYGLSETQILNITGLKDRAQRVKGATS